MPGSFEVEESFRFLGRTYAEYRRMFGLAAADLGGRRVLDCPGGPGSFAAVAGETGADVTAVDPRYRADRGVLAEECTTAVDRTVAQLREKRDMFVWTEYGDPETRGRYLRAAAQRFLADLATTPERYVAAALPTLPFADDAFDLALSANLCFLYDDRLDREFHEAALRELARVTAEEVRVFPLHALDGDRSALVDPAVEALRADGHAVRFEPVPYEFQPGATEALVVSPT